MATKPAAPEGTVVVTISAQQDGAAEEKKPAEKETDPLLAAIKELPKQIGAAVKEPKKDKPIPSGIKPRGLILPVLVTLVMCLPICALVLPVSRAFSAQRVGASRALHLRPSCCPM